MEGISRIIRTSTARRFLLGFAVLALTLGTVASVGLTSAQTNASTGGNGSVDSPIAGSGVGAPQDGSGGNLPDADLVISSAASFSQLDPGETAVIPSDATIEMPVSKEGTVIPAGARVISDGGTLVYSGSPRTGTFDPERMLVMESNAQLVGVNVVGPVAGLSEPEPNDKYGGRNENAIMIGVTVEGQGVRILRSTVRGWPCANVRFVKHASGQVAYSRIVGAYESDRGYGVSTTGNANVVIAASYFNRNRHSVEAGDDASYTITDSVIGPQSVSHSLDVHPPAGGHYVYRNLTVMSDVGLTMRQVPKGGAVVQNVWFTQAKPANAISQIDQHRVSNPSASQTHAGSKIADAADGFSDFRNMQFSGVHFGANPPPGIGAPPSMPSPDEIPNAPVSGPGAGFVDPGAIEDLVTVVVGVILALLALIIGGAIALAYLLERGDGGDSNGGEAFTFFVVLFVATTILVGAVGPAVGQQAPTPNNGSNVTNLSEVAGSRITPTPTPNATLTPASNATGVNRITPNGGANANVSAGSSLFNINATNRTNATDASNNTIGGLGPGNASGGSSGSGSGGWLDVPSAGDLVTGAVKAVVGLFTGALVGLVLLPQLFTYTRINTLQNTATGTGVAGGLWARPTGMFGAAYDIAMQSIIWIAFTLFVTFLVIDWFGNFRAYPGADGPVDRLLLRAADCLHLLFSWPIAWGHFLIATFFTALFMPGRQEITGTITNGVGNLAGALGIGAAVFVLPLIGVVILWLFFKHGGAFVYLLVGLAAYPLLVAASIPDDSRWLGRLGSFMEGARQNYVVAAWWPVPTAVVLGIGYAIDDALLEAVTAGNLVPDALGGAIIYPILWIAALYAPIKVFSGGTPPRRLRYRTPSRPGMPGGGGGGGGSGTTSALVAGSAAGALAAGASSGAGAASTGASTAGSAASSFPRLEAPSGSMRALSSDGGMQAQTSHAAHPALEGTVASGPSPGVGATTGTGPSAGGDIPGGGDSGGSAFSGSSGGGTQYGPGSSRGTATGTTGSSGLTGDTLNQQESVTRVAPNEFDAGQRYEPYVYQGGDFNRIDPPKNAEWLTEDGGFNRLNEATDDPLRFKGEDDGQFYDLTESANSDLGFNGSQRASSTTANAEGTDAIRGN